MLESGDLSFLGFKVSASIGLDVSSGNLASPPTPTFQLPSPSLSVSDLLEDAGSCGPTYDAAVRTARDPGRGDAICATALAATMLPFKPRFYGHLRPLAYEGTLLCRSGSSLQTTSTPTSGELCRFRFVASGRRAARARRSSR